MPIRQRPAHGVLQFDGKPTIVFGTVCTKDRIPWLASADVHSVLRDVWSKADTWLLGRYVIMPDHIHFFAGWAGDEIDFDSWVKYWKSQFSKTFKRPQYRWQTEHWDTRLRSAETYEEKWIYVQNNPVRHGLVSQPQDWPFQGQIHSLPWD